MGVTWYFLVGKDGGAYAFGDAHILGSVPGLGDYVNDVVGIARASGPAVLRTCSHTSWFRACPQDQWTGIDVKPLVGEGGLEPPHPFGHRNLNPARLPIPPLARATG
jgi:hypothetical protein